MIQKSLGPIQETKRKTFDEINQEWREFVFKKKNEQTKDIRFLFLKHKDFLNIIASFMILDAVWRNDPLTHEHPRYQIYLVTNSFGVASISGYWNTSLEINHTILTHKYHQRIDFNEMELSILQSLFEEFNMNEKITKCGKMNTIAKKGRKR